MEGRNNRRKHFHCYLLRSANEKKSYIGFTTDPHRRIRQHNGLLKHGGAWRTRRSGRPWELVVVVCGFSDKKTALSFEWIWQHAGSSLAVRNAIGDTDAACLSRKRGTKGKLAILKTILTECTEQFHHKLNLCFFDNEWKYAFEQQTKPRFLPEWIECEVTPSVEHLPFWKDRKRRRENGLRQTNSVKSCHICQHSIKQLEEKLFCEACNRAFHSTCVELHSQERGYCPSCLEKVDWNNYSDDDSDSDAGSCPSSSKTLPLVSHGGSNKTMMEDSSDDDDDDGLFRVIPATLAHKTTSTPICIDLSDSEESMSWAPAPPARRRQPQVICLCDSP